MEKERKEAEEVKRKAAEEEKQKREEEQKKQEEAKKKTAAKPKAKSKGDSPAKKTNSKPATANAGHEFEIVLDKTNGGSLGINVATLNDGSLKIESIQPFQQGK